MTEDFLKVDELTKIYGETGIWEKITGSKPRLLKALTKVNLTVEEGETVGIVGESGCGKTTLGECIVKLEPITEGEILFRGKEIRSIKMDDKEFRKNVQMVFQDPTSSLNPRKSVKQILSQQLEELNIISRHKEEKEARIDDLMKDVGLPIDYKDSSPIDLSGGEKQRVNIARALASKPDLVVCDEIVSGLDVSVQASILNLLGRLKEDRNLTIIFISHNLSVVKYISDRIFVMYLGKIMEKGKTENVFTEPSHPYVEALLSAIPTIGDLKKERIHLKGAVPSPIDMPSGCAFNTRCPKKIGSICENEEPTLRKVENNHFISCHLF